MAGRLRRVFSPALVGALVAFLVVVGCLSAAVGEWGDGELIDAAPVRVTGRIVSAIPHEKSTDFTVNYRVRDRTYRTDTRTLSLAHLTASPSVGAPVPLEVASGDPSVARVQGADSPNENLPPLFLLAAAGGVVGLVAALRALVRNARKRT
ncbi:hypothetical protein [Streptomyces sp. NPDC048442]|uniref:hypothetical protein n=1 Tax=Streptomyces sp. NPDC048442 TaxID=3154823 RepID=UPI00343B89F3